MSKLFTEHATCIIIMLCAFVVILPIFMNENGVRLSFFISQIQLLYAGTYWIIATCTQILQHQN